MFYKTIKLIEINIGKNLASQIANWNARFNSLSENNSYSKFP